MAGPRFRQRVTDALILGLLSYLSARIGVYFLIRPEGMAPFWFANGVVLTVLLRRRTRDWPLLLLATFAGFVVNMRLSGFPLYPDAIYGIGNAVEPMIAATIIQRIVPRFSLRNLRALGVLIVSALIASAAGATIAWLVGPVRWSLWLINDWLGILLVTPALLVFWPVSERFLRFSRPTAKQIFEMAALLCGMALVSVALSFRFSASGAFLFSYAPLPFLLWATLRYKTPGATIASLLLGLLAIGSITFEVGPLAAVSPALIDRSLLIQTYLAIVLLSHLSLGVALEERARASEVERHQIEILGRIGQGEPLKSVLEQIVRFVEAQEAGLLCSILLLDAKERRIRHGAAPSMPSEFVRAIDGLIIGPTAGSCGAAAHFGTTVIVEDISTHPNWADYKHLALPLGLRACWSSPVFSPTRDVLGTFAIYYKEPRAPSEEEEHWVAAATHLAAVAILRDRYESSIKQLEEQISFAQRMESLGTLASGIAHDFNNILSAMMGNVTLIREELAHDAAVQDKLNRVEAAGKRASDLVEQILTFSRQSSPKRTAVHLRPVVEEAIGLLRATLPAMIEIKTRFGAESKAVLADSSQIHQIVMNLGVNAAHAMEDRGGVLEVHLESATLDAKIVSAHSEIRPGNYMRLEVSDNGRGMDGETLARIFDPFFTTKNPGRGTGLGLSVVHGIVKSHGGAIAIESIPGTGSRFSLYFPAVSTPEPDKKPSSATGESQGHGERILYVDDDEAVTQVVSELLRNRGYRPTVMADPSRAFETIVSQRESFAAILIDYEMPVMSGLELVRRLRSRSIETPIVLVSGFVPRQAIEELRELNVQEVLTKPGFLKEIPEVLGALLRQGRVQADDR